MNTRIERDAWELTQLTASLEKRTPHELAGELAQLEEARNNLTRAILRAKEARHAA
jgi:hypothetical protein